MNLELTVFILCAKLTALHNPDVFRAVLHFVASDPCESQNTGGTEQQSGTHTVQHAALT